MTTVIFACVHNAGRSQIAAAFFNKYADNSKVVAISAGTKPEKQIHPIVIEIMNEVDFDLSQNVPKKLTVNLLNIAQYLITMGCEENCPYKPTLKILEWKFDDPKDMNTDQARRLRDHIEIQVKTFLAQNLWLK